MPTVIEKLASICGHRFGRYAATLRAGDCRKQIGHCWSNQDWIGASKRLFQVTDRNTKAVAALRSTRVRRLGFVVEQSPSMLHRRCLAK